MCILVVHSYYVSLSFTLSGPLRPEIIATRSLDVYGPHVRVWWRPEVDDHAFGHFPGPNTDVMTQVKDRTKNTTPRSQTRHLHPLRPQLLLSDNHYRPTLLTYLSHSYQPITCKCGE